MVLSQSHEDLLCEIEQLELMERPTTEFVRAGIDWQQQNPAISECEGATVQALL
jgi:hypothetical protein